MQLGLAGMVLAPALVIVGFILSPTMYHLSWDAAQAATGAARVAALKAVGGAENTMLLQIRSGLLFAILIFIGLRARATDPGFHKRMMILAIAPALGAGLARIAWLPTTLPASAASQDIGVLTLIAPMLAWDLIRNRSVHQAYWVWLAFALPASLALHLLWDTPWWHATARAIMGV
jgi:hypothetical protein